MRFSNVNTEPDLNPSISDAKISDAIISDSIISDVKMSDVLDAYRGV